MFEQRSLQLQKIKEQAIACINPGSFVERFLAQAIGATALLALMREFSCGSQPPVPPGELFHQACAVDKAAAGLGVVVLHTLNGFNSMPGLNWTALPLWLSLTLMQACLDRGYITADGEPVYRQQPKKRFRASLVEFIKLEPSFVGTFSEVFGDDSMNVVSDLYPWIHAKVMAGIVGSMLPVSRCSTAAYIAWLCQLLKRVPQLLAVQTAVARPAYAAAIAAWSACSAGMRNSSCSCTLAGHGGSGAGSRPQQSAVMARVSTSRV
jgi:hypothetical protein